MVPGHAKGMQLRLEGLAYWWMPGADGRAHGVLGWRFFGGRGLEMPGMGMAGVDRSGKSEGTGEVDGYIDGAIGVYIKKPRLGNEMTPKSLRDYLY